MEPVCPLCGAKSTWVYLDGMPASLHNSIPDDCHFCKTEEHMHWKDWQQGIDVTQTGSEPINAMVELPENFVN